MNNVLIQHGPSTDLLVICDHATADLPPGVDLGLTSAQLSSHIAVDIGALDVARLVAEAFQASMVATPWSRLFVDVNRPPEDPASVPAVSDGLRIAGNEGLSPAQIGERHAFHEDYHEAVDAQIRSQHPSLLLSVHSFTPCLETGEPRPWHCALLYDQDDRAARIAISHFEGRGFVVGNNEPYDGTNFGYTVQRHAEPLSLPYLFLEIRQDLLETEEMRATWAGEVRDMVDAVLRHLVTA